MSKHSKNEVTAPVEPTPVSACTVLEEILARAPTAKRNIILSSIGPSSFDSYGQENNSLTRAFTACQLNLVKHPDPSKLDQYIQCSNHNKEWVKHLEELKKQKNEQCLVM
jgi:hypothetical protein